MISAIGMKDLNNNLLIDKCVCNSDDPNCMLGHCRKCPGERGVTSFLHSIENLEERESIKYMQWVSTDRSTLETILKTVDDFIELLARKK